MTVCECPIATFCGVCGRPLYPGMLARHLIEIAKDAHDEWACPACYWRLGLALMRADTPETGRTASAVQRGPVERPRPLPVPATPETDRARHRLQPPPVQWGPVEPALPAHTSPYPGQLEDERRGDEQAG